MAAYANRSWIGLRFLRSLPMMNTPDILQYMGVVKSSRTIRITRLASKFIAVWFTAAGLVHLVENSGDFFCNYCNAQELDIFNAVYYMIVTMTTTQGWSWRDLYHRGAGMEMYLEEMSPSFYGKTYTESALICFKLRVMLLAVDMRQTDEHGHMRSIVDVVPCDECVIVRGCRAFVVGISSEDASRFACFAFLKKQRSIIDVVL
ncbi:unnamed protein product [Rotaria sp. Silwood2]|nr:unnamed protein product [Rotaria sp. Silwood2]CAF4301030.1 unnamed protein product [Rotaria sp. Silwood2]